MITDAETRYKWRDEAIARAEKVYRRQLTDEEKTLVSFVIGYVMGRRDAYEAGTASNLQ